MRKLTRREALAGAAAGVLGAGGVYELVDKLAGAAPARAAGTPRLEQHLLEGIRVVRSDGIEVLVPPLHHRILTATVAVHRADLRDAQKTLEKTLAGLEHDYAPTPAGLGVTVAWGLPYFSRFVEAKAKKLLPFDRRALKPVLFNAQRFPSDPFDTKLEHNDVAILLRSDMLAHIKDAQARIEATKAFRLTSVRSGFAHGTHMHLSHIHEDLEAWYLNFAFDERVATAFRPNLNVKPGTQTVRQGPQDVSDVAKVRHDYRVSGRIGHSAAIQTTSRLAHDVSGPDGAVYVKGAAIPVRADFNTLDNPFTWSANGNEVQPVAAAGVHFVVFNPTGDDFRRNRLAMDGVLPGGKIPFPARDRNQGFNSVLSTTHRQNFLVPPRRHRSFPLAEL